MLLLADSVCGEDLFHRWYLLVALRGGRRQEGLGNVWCSITALMFLKVPPSWASLVTQLVKNPPAEPETQVSKSHWATMTRSKSTKLQFQPEKLQD